MIGRATRRSGRPGPLALALSGILAAAATASTSEAASGERGLEGNPFRGRTLFAEKRCVMCHSVWGHGGATGPDIARSVAGKALPQLTGEFWNHTPRMIDEMKSRGHPWPTLDRGEMADILSYLYYLKLFDRPGDPARGAATYARLSCERCHSLGGDGGRSGGALDRFSAYPSAVPLAQAMWNSGPAMRRLQMGTGGSIPEFSGTEMVDIQAYIRERGLREGRQVELLPLPDPGRGAEVFRARQCAVCHGSGDGATEFGAAALRQSVGEIAGVLWNHSYAMQERMRARGIPFPVFRGSEMADVISYLHFLGYLGRPGDSSRGARVFLDKGCAACHRGSTGPGPDLAGVAPSADAIALSASMWNHAPQMHELMADRSAPWPKFEPGDMEDLAAFLRELAADGGASER